MEKVVLGLSGGMDSTTLLGYFLKQNMEIHCCFFDYGSKHNSYEWQAINNILSYYAVHGFLNSKIFFTYFDMKKVFYPFKSNLLKEQGAIPEGHYESEQMKQTVVPGRNLIFASIMAGLAESIEAKYIALGVHSGDHFIYPDCRPRFISYLTQTVQESTEGKVTVLAPFIDDDKTCILYKGFAFKLKVPYHLTRTCYKDQELSCGKCGSCTERLEAFKNLEITDPINYE